MRAQRLKRTPVCKINKKVKKHLNIAAVIMRFWPRFPIRSEKERSELSPFRSLNKAGISQSATIIAFAFDSLPGLKDKIPGFQLT